MASQLSSAEREKLRTTSMNKQAILASFLSSMFGSNSELIGRRMFEVVESLRVDQMAPNKTSPCDTEESRSLRNIFKVPGNRSPNISLHHSNHCTGMHCASFHSIRYEGVGRDVVLCGNVRVLTPASGSVSPVLVEVPSHGRFSPATLTIPH